MERWRNVFAITAKIGQRMGRRSLIGGMVLVSAIAVIVASDLSQFMPAQATVSRIVFSAPRDPATFNPAFNYLYPNVFPYTFRGLVTIDGETGEIIPELAKSWEISEDSLTYVLTLRDDLRWSDGEPLTADDIVFTYREVTFNDRLPVTARDSFRIGPEGLLPTVAKVSDRQVQFNLPEPYTPLLRYLELPILPAHVLQESVTTLDSQGNLLFTSAWTTASPASDIVVNGPYRLKQYLPRQQVVFERNPYYWRQDDQGNQQPYIQELVWQVVESSDEQMAQFRAGALDVIDVEPDEVATMQQAEASENFTIYDGGPSLGHTFIAFNLNQASRNGQPLVDPIKSRWFNSVAFRRAVAHAINRPHMVDAIYRGLAELQMSPLPVQSPFYAGPDQGIPSYDYAPEKARALLAEDGFQYDVQGQLLDTEGNPVQFTLITNSGNRIREAMGRQIQQDLAQIGIQVDFQPISFNALITKLSDSLDWDAHILGFTTNLEPNSSAPVWLLDGTLHVFNQTPLAGQEPLDGWQAAEWEKDIADIYRQAAQELDDEKRYALYQESQRLAQEYLPFIYLVNPFNLGAVRNTIQGVKYSSLVRPPALWNMHELKMAPDLAISVQN
ncbi:MAG: ABC transporter substrate-binding protein [Cyanobacteria bacterium P01_F01_bin.86]